MSQKEAQPSSSNGPDDPSISMSYKPPYFDRLLGIILAGESISIWEAAMRNFDKQVFTSIHDNARIYLTNPDVGKIMLIQGTLEEDQQVTDECTEAADKLVPVSLKDLKQGERNECVVLYGELCVEHFQFGRIYTVLEEVGTGNAVALSIFSSIDQTFAGKNYPKGSKIAVKEPRLVKVEGGLVFVEVNNPLCIETVSPSFPTLADLSIRVSTENFRNWMHCAREAYEAKEWEKCNRALTKCDVMYSKGTTVDKGLVYNLYSHRWVSRIYVEKYAEALSDAETCCMLDPYHIFGVKAKLQSLLSVGRFREAFGFLERSCGLDRFNEDQKKQFTSIYREYGESYFHMGDAITGGAEPGTHRGRFFKQDGDFIGPVEIRMTSNDCGRGLFATENIQAGNVVLISKALALSSKPMQDPTRNGLLQNVKNALSSCGDKTLQLFLSHGTFMPNHLSQIVPRMSDFIGEENDLAATATNKNVCAVTVGEIFDNLILDILERIGLGDSSPAAIQKNGKPPVILTPLLNSVTRLYYGVWLLASFVNHSCDPNAARINAGDIMRIHATKRIEKGQEITIPYFSVFAPYRFREASWKAFGFSCDCKCKRCEEERKIITDPEYIILCKEYFRICKLVVNLVIPRPSEVNCLVDHLKNWSKLMNGLVEQVEKCLKLLRERNLVGNTQSEAWIRSSFMAVYFARISCRKYHIVPNLPSEHMLEEESTITRAAHSALSTCPGDIQVVRFFQLCSLFWRDLPALNPLRFTGELRAQYEESSRCASQAMEEACFFVYGLQQEGVLASIVKKLRDETF